MRIGGTLIYIILLLFFCECLRAQTVAYRHYTDKDGVPSTIYDIYRDSKGFLWFGTDKGVARYNGISFERFTTFDGLPDNDIFYFQEDAYHRLWMSTFNGELCYYKDGVFHNSTNTALLRTGNRSSIIHSIISHSDSSISVLFYDMSQFINIHGDKSFRFDLKKLWTQTPAAIVNHIRKTEGDIYQLICVDKVITVDKNYRILKVSPHRRPGSVYNFTITQNQEYLTGARGIYDMDERVVCLYDSFYKKAFFTENVRSVFRAYKDGRNLLVGTNNGLVINGKLHLFKGLEISAITQDLDGNYWIGTLRHGVFCLNRYFEDITDNRKVYPGAVVYAAAKNGILYFINQENDLFRFANGRSERIFYFRRPENKKVFGYVQPGYFIDKDLTYYSFYEGDNVVISALDKRPSAAYKKHPLLGQNIKNVQSDGKYIYLQSAFNIDRLHYSDTGLSITRLYASNRDRIFCISMDSNKHLWYSTIKGMFRLSGMQPAPQPQFNHATFEAFDILANFLVGITHDNKLVVCSNIHKNVTPDTIKNQNCIWGRMYKLGNNQLLLSTDNQYRLLTLNTSGGKPFYTLDIIENSFLPLQAEYICADSANLYFFKDGNITATSRQKLLAKPNPPMALFTSVRTNRRTLLASPVIRLPYSASQNVSISYSALSFANRNLVIEYSISKDEREHWQPIRGQEILLADPAPGEYKVMIRARSLSSNYSKPAVLMLHIATPFWKTWWFYLGIILVASFSLAMAVRYFVRRALKKKEKKHREKIQFLKSEYKAMNALMNPHFIFNSLNNIQSLVNNDDKRDANLYLSVLSQLVRQNMHNISKELIPLRKEIELATAYLKLEKLRFKERLQYTIDIDENIDPELIDVPPLLIQPLIENAIKHGFVFNEANHNTIYIRIYESKQALHIEVEDNGMGIERSQKNKDASHRSYGLGNIRHRMAQLQEIFNRPVSFNIYELKDANDNIAGTRATVIMYIDSDVYA